MASCVLKWKWKEKEFGVLEWKWKKKPKCARLKIKREKLWYDIMKAKVEKLSLELSLYSPNEPIGNKSSFLLSPHLNPYLWGWFLFKPFLLRFESCFLLKHCSLAFDLTIYFKLYIKHCLNPKNHTLSIKTLTLIIIIIWSLKTNP
jgi:hypothetical protein